MHENAHCGLYLRAASIWFEFLENLVRLQFKGVFNSRAACNDDFTVFSKIYLCIVSIFLRLVHYFFSFFCAPLLAAGEQFEAMTLRSGLLYYSIFYGETKLLKHWLTSNTIIGDRTINTLIKFSKCNLRAFLR